MTAPLEDLTLKSAEVNEREPYAMTEEAAVRSERCGACLGTGTVARYYSDGSFDPVDCDDCHGFGGYNVWPDGAHRDPQGRFVG